VASAFHRPLPRRRRCQPRARTYATKCRPSGVGVAVRVVALTTPTSAHPVGRSKSRIRSPASKPFHCEEYHQYRFRSQSVSSFTMASVRVTANPLIQSRQYRGTASDETPPCSTPSNEAGPKTRAKERRDTVGRGRRGRILAYCLIRPGESGTVLRGPQVIELGNESPYLRCRPRKPSQEIELAAALETLARQIG